MKNNNFKIRSKRTYDHRIKIMVADSRNPNLFPKLKIPKTTAMNWINNGVAEVVSLERCFEVIGLSKPRFHHWVKRQKQCQLEDQSSCPRLVPSKIADNEINSIKELVQDVKHSHFSKSSLWLLARRNKAVIVSLSSWFRIINEFSFKRVVRKKYIQKAKKGLRAKSSNQIWHIDVSIIRLLDGTRAYIQSIIDNFSRFVLAAKVDINYGANHTIKLIKEGIAKLKELRIF